jgi:hypothetical protein
MHRMNWKSAIIALEAAHGLDDALAELNDRIDRQEVDDDEDDDILTLRRDVRNHLRVILQHQGELPFDILALFDDDDIVLEALGRLDPDPEY